MNKLSINTLKALRKAYTKLFNVQPLPKPACENDPDKVSQIIYDKLMDDKPCMIARFGANELTSLVNYVGVKNNQHDYLAYIKGKALPWWWNMNHIKENMYNVAGFFPPTQEKIEQFCELMLEDMKDLDVLGSWLGNELNFESELKNVSKVDRGLMDPFFTNIPWTKALEGKTVLIVHPFKESIIHQYNQKEKLFKNEILPNFKLEVIKSVQSLAGQKTPYNDWFEALDFMKSEIDKIDYDVCLIAAGAYGFHLAAHVKRMGKKAVHVGGSLQLFFGIIGKRWETKGYAKDFDYPSLINEFWIRPSLDEVPNNIENVENGCYW